MATTVTRITVNFSEGATEWLNKEAGSRGITVSDYIRRLVDETRGEFVVKRRVKAA